jgi:3,4-dihydroxy 2-butanone 4-phosphate synthase/GTP cyclohydrolase II
MSQSPNVAEAPVHAALRALRAGQVCAIVEDLAGGQAVWAMLPAAGVDEAAVNLLADVARGVVTVAMPQARAEGLDFPLLERKRAPQSQPRYAVSVEAAVGVSTGISAADRALTVRQIAEPHAAAADFVRPGHVMPALVGKRGCLERPYGPEVAHDLMVLAGLAPLAAMSHVLDELDALRPADADAFCAQRGWPVVRASEVLAWRANHERLVRVTSEGKVDTAEGPFRIRVYENELDGTSHVALVRDPPKGAPQGPPPLVRLHSQCLTGDILHSRRCDCGDQLRLAMQQVAVSGHGAVVYLRQEGRGIGLVQKIRAYALQDQGVDTVEANLQLGFQADERDYAVAAQILRDLDMNEVRLLTNNPHKLQALTHLGIEVAERVAIEVPPTTDNLRYLQTKRDRMGHLLEGM